MQPRVLKVWFICALGFDYKNHFWYSGSTQANHDYMQIFFLIYITISVY